MIQKVISKLASSVGDIQTIEPYGCLIYIDNKELTDYHTFTLQQSFNDHHYFEITIPTESLLNAGVEEVPRPESLIGKKIVMQLYKGFSLGADSNDFTGIITYAGYKQTAANRTILSIKGQSKTYLLNTICNRIYQNRTLQDIVSDIEASAQGQLTIEKNPSFSSFHPIIMQQQQSNMDFLNHIAYTYGQWLFYYQNKLCFGRPKWVNRQKAITLQLGKNLTTQTLYHEWEPLAQKSFFSYTPAHDQLYQQTDWQPSHPNTYGSYAVNHMQQADKWMSQNTASSPIPIHAAYKQEVDQYLRTQKAIAASRSYTIQGESTEHLLCPAALISLGNRNTYIITAATHSFDNHTKLYNNSFTAIPNTPEAFPHNAKTINIPKAVPQLANVVGDPNAKGEVQVCLHGTTNTKYYAWLPVAQPDIHGRNGGFHFLPVKGSLVLIDYLYGLSCFPYISRSMPHGKNTHAADNLNNSKRSISTPKQHKIVFDDQLETRGITIQDAQGSSIHIQSQDGYIHISSNNLQLQADNIEFNSKNTHITIEQQIHIQSQKDITIQSKNIKTEGGNTLLVQADSTTLVGNKALKKAGKKVSIAAKENLNLYA